MPSFNRRPLCPPRTSYETFSTQVPERTSLSECCLTTLQVLNRDVAQCLAETGNDRARCRAAFRAPGSLRACVPLAEGRHTASKVDV